MNEGNRAGFGPYSVVLKNAKKEEIKQEDIKQEDKESPSIAGVYNNEVRLEINMEFSQTKPNIGIALYLLTAPLGSFS